jgi:hypothetical protein
MHFRSFQLVLRVPWNQLDPDFARFHDFNDACQSFYFSMFLTCATITSTSDGKILQTQGYRGLVHCLCTWLQECLSKTFCRDNYHLSVVHKEDATKSPPTGASACNWRQIDGIVFTKSHSVLFYKKTQIGHIFWQDTLTSLTNSYMNLIPENAYLNRIWKKQVYFL